MRGVLGFAAIVAVCLACWNIGTPTAGTGPGGIGPELWTGQTMVNVLRGDAERFLRARCYRNPWTPYAYPDVRAIPGDRVRAILATWRNRRFIARTRESQCNRIRHRALWMCIHAREGAWNDPNPPYFGGLQMGYWFMGAYGDRNTYGRDIYRQEGTANNWAPHEQMGVAEAAYREEGYSYRWLQGQWPNTHQGCGS